MIRSKRKRWLYGLGLIHVFAPFIWIAAFPLLAATAEPPTPKRILALYWYGKDFYSNVEFDRGIQMTLRGTGVDYHAEYFEPNKFPGEGQAIALRDYLQRKYADRKIDVIIAMSAVSADFLLSNRASLFPDAPIVLHANTTNQLKERAAQAPSTGVVPDNVHARTLETALSLHPDTEHVYVINGTIEQDKSVEALLKERFSEVHTRAEITYLTDLPLGPLLARVKSLPARSLIFYSRQDYEDPSRSLSLIDVLVLVAASAHAPIYSTGNSYVGHGTIGGYGVNAYQCGVEAAKMALKILDGTPAQSIPIVEVPSLPVFDWRELRRWGLNEDRFPPGSEFRFREPTLFEQHKWRILSGIALFIIQTLLIAGLLAERQRRLRAQGALRERLEFETLLSELSADFTRLPPEEVDHGIEKWLQRLVEFLKVDSAALLAESSPEAQQPAVLAVPIHVAGSAWTLRFDAKQSPRVAWPEDLLPRLRLAGEILAGALVRNANGQALRETQERYKLATGSGGVVVWDWDLETSKFYADPLLKTLLGYQDNEIGNYFDDWIRLVHPADVGQVLQRIDTHIQSRSSRFEAEHRFVRKDGAIRWFLASGSVVCNEAGTAVRIVGTEMDITKRKLAEQELQHLSARLLDSQDQERRRIARELHDGTAQNICAILLNLKGLNKSSAGLPAKFQAALSDCYALCDQSLREIRTLSYVLHPPMLDQTGLVAALRWFLDGFAQRSGIDVDLVATADVGRLPPEIEMDLFRVVQECLANVHRHSGSSTAQLWIERQATQVQLRVKDQGHGMPSLPAEREDSGQLGVGLSGMRQRLRHLGGRLEIESSSQGTTITAIVPLPADSGNSPVIDTASLENQEARAR